MLEELRQCGVCPFRCKVNRLEGKIGKCGCNDKIKIALASLHYYEEPCISGKNGSGTVFFSNCNFKCIFCQNYKISQEGKGNEVTIEELANIFLKLQQEGANNINLVTPTMYTYQIIEAIKIARMKGLNLPIIYNSNGYENVETLRDLRGYVDVYLPDLKYYADELAIKYSKAPNYFKIATKAILKMIDQVGLPEFDENGMIKKGVIIRHLVLPGHIQNSKHILKWLKENVSIMFQDGQLYALPLIYNIIMRPIQNKDADEKLVWDLLDKVGIASKIQKLPLTIYTPISNELDDYGTSFSGGEMQKILLARSLANTKLINIYDEVSNAMDVESKKDAVKLIRKYNKK